MAKKMSPVVLREYEILLKLSRDRAESADNDIGHRSRHPSRL